MQRKIIEMLAPADTDQAHYDVGEIYSVPTAIAERFLREGVAKYVHFELDDKPKPKKRSRSQKPWRETVRPGDTYNWQITLSLASFDKARIIPELRLYADEAALLYGEAAVGMGEIGGDGDNKPSPEQAKAIDYLAQNEAALYSALLPPLVEYAKTFRSDWETNAPETVDQILPHELGPAEIEQRAAFRTIYISPRCRSGIAYIEISGDCIWDPEHGFSIILHQNRIVDVTQPGTGWSDSEHPAP